MTNQQLLAELRGGAGRRRHPHRRSEPDAAAVDAGDPAAAAAGAIAAVPDRGDLALRRARPRLVLEQHQLRRAYRDPLRRTGALDHRPRSAGRPHRHDPAPAPDRTGLRDRLHGRGRGRRGFRPRASARPGLGGGARPDRGRRVGAHADRLVEAGGPGGLPQCQGGRPARARAERRDDAPPGRGARISCGWGVEAVGTDAGQAFAFEPPFPAHNLLHGAGRFGLASLCNLDQLPPKGALLITPPLKIEHGSGSPLRVLALVAG